MENKSLKLFWFFTSITVFSVILRFLPHPPNFTSIGALALISGLLLPNKWALFIAPALMFLTDLFIGLYDWRVMISVYVGFFMYFIVSKIFREGKERFFLSPLVGASLFFLITNFAVWAFTPAYAHDFEGLILAYVFGLPFFKNMFLADFAFFSAFSGALYVVFNWSLVKSKISLSKPSNIIGHFNISQQKHGSR